MRRSTSGGRIAPSVRIVWNWLALCFIASPPAVLLAVLQKDETTQDICWKNRFDPDTARHASGLPDPRVRLKKFLRPRLRRPLNMGHQLPDTREQVLELTLHQRRG